MESSSSTTQRKSTGSGIPLIPCPFCGEKLLTFLCGPTGSRPGDHFYKCCKKDSGKCRFYEWQDGYAKYLPGNQDAVLAGDQIPSAQAPPPQRALGAHVAAVTSLPAYEWSGYILKVTRCAAEKFRADLLAGAKTYTLRGCNLLLQLFYLEWSDFKAVSLHTDLVPKIAVYSAEKMDELIKLGEEDRQRTGDNRMEHEWHGYEVAPPDGSYRTELATTPKTVGVQEGMDNIMLVIEETVMPMMMDAVVTVATEMTEANRGSVIEDMCSKVEEQKKKLQICFGSKLYPDAVHMSPNFPAIKYGGNSVSGVGAAEYKRGSSSRGLAAPGGFSWMLMTLPVKQRQMQVSLMAVLPQTTTKEILPTLATRKLQTQHRQGGSSWFE